MDPAVARNIATAAHLDQRTRAGELVLEHVARVAAGVGPDAEVTAWLHDLFERSDTSAEELRAQGLSSVELDALELLTRSPVESYELYALRIAYAPGEAGRLARAVKLADLDDHVDNPPMRDDPPYKWARRHIARAQHRQVALATHPLQSAAS